LSVSRFLKTVLGEAKDIGWEKVRFLRAIGVHEEAIGKVIVEFPAFLSFSLDRKIRPVVKENSELLLLFHVSIEKPMGNVSPFVTWLYHLQEDFLLKDSSSFSQRSIMFCALYNPYI
jgi:hypothetical protein